MCGGWPERVARAFIAHYQMANMLESSFGNYAKHASGLSISEMFPPCFARNMENSVLNHPSVFELPRVLLCDLTHPAPSPLARSLSARTRAGSARTVRVAAGAAARSRHCGCANEGGSVDGVRISGCG